MDNKIILKTNKGVSHIMIGVDEDTISFVKTLKSDETVLVGKNRIVRSNIVAIGSTKNNITEPFLKRVLSYGDIKIRRPNGDLYAHIPAKRIWYKNYHTNAAMVRTEHGDVHKEQGNIVSGNITIFHSWQTALECIGNPRYVIIYNKYS